MTNQEVARLLRNVAAAYSIKDEKKHIFQIIAYQKAADAIYNLPHELKDVLRERTQEKIPGVGPSILSHLEELFAKGRVKHFEEIMKGIPPSVFPLLKVTTLGPKKAYKLTSHLKLNFPDTIVDDLIIAAQKNKIAGIPTFGEKSQADILRALEEYKLGKIKANRMPLPYAFELARKTEEYLRKSKFAEQVFPLGSLRRMMATVGDIDFAVATKQPKEIINHFINYPGTERVIEKGEASSSILVSGGRQVDLMVQDPDSFGSLLQHFTGSKYHNVALREFALKKGMSLSEYGVKVRIGKKQELKKFKTEKDFYQFLGLDWIIPEMRENKGEIELAIKHNLPKIVELKDIRGDLHIHSSYPIEPSHDLGKDTMQQMLGKSRSLGYDYIAFSEHNPGITNHSKNQIYSILAKRSEYIEQLKESNKGIRIINLLEVDILPSGELAMDDKSLDYVEAAIVSVHSVFSTPRQKMTKRVLRGLSNPKAKILAHPSGRLINQREEYELDWDEIFDFALKHNKAIEINAWPTRLDLTDTLVDQARKMGVKFVIDTDSHASYQMDNMFYGVSVARRGWCTKKDILNTLPYEQFYKWLTG
ncbi:MAG: PHP domain protein [Microgenomates group bacterium GW2011_GWC1_39_7]|nr:MAG: PHP domain protein [Microgenomates group bacterium GW2011_GWC1_39_7]